MLPRALSLFLPALTLLAAPLGAADSPFTLPRETAALKPGAGADLATGNCLLCHSADYISTQPPLSRAQWQAIVVKMQQKFGAPVTTNQIPPIVDYLSATYGSRPHARNPPP